MKHLQKLVAIVLAFVLALSLSLTALAEEDYGQEVTGEGNLFQNNEAQTTFSVVAVPANLSATVPLNVTFAVKRNGDFVCPGGYAITNTGSEIFHVSDIRVTMLDAAYSFVESDENLQDRQIYLTMTGTNPGIMSPRVLFQILLLLCLGMMTKSNRLGLSPRHITPGMLIRAEKLNLSLREK